MSASSTTARAYVIAIRVVLLLAAAGAVVGAVAVALRGRGGSDHIDKPAALFVCPMHPEVRSTEHGQCPICRMELEKVAVATDNGHRMNKGEKAAMEDMTAIDNVRKHRIMDFVRLRALLVPEQEMRGPAVVGEDGVVTAVLYDDYIAALAPAEQGTFTPSQTPGVTFAVRRTADSATMWDRSTSRLRFAAAPKQPASVPGTVGWLELARRPRQVLAVPVNAVIQSPEGPYVLAANPRTGELEKRHIELGETWGKQTFAVVLSGLHKYDRVVERAAFFLDADRKLAAHDNSEVTWAAP